jgi:hypothetical protein
MATNFSMRVVRVSGLLRKRVELIAVQAEAEPPQTAERKMTLDELIGERSEPARSAAHGRRGSVSPALKPSTQRGFRFARV